MARERPSETTKTPAAVPIDGHSCPGDLGMPADMKRMRGQVTLEIVLGATHLFEEPGTLERRRWGLA